MRLNKWYLDAVLADGTVWYGYQARLQFRGCPAIHWTSGCRVRRDDTERKASHWKKWAEPQLNGGRWRWTGPDGFHARWLPKAGGVESVLGSDDHFKVRWNCVVPMAHVSVTGVARNGEAHPGNSVCDGVGYVEHLSIETASATLPFRQLWWGRAHAGDSSLVWIRWGTGRDLNLLIENGREVNGRFETFDGGVRVETALGHWETGVGRSLCDRDVRRSFPRFLVWMVRGMVPSRERKLTGPVRLRTAAGEFTGSGIWEEVTWS